MKLEFHFNQEALPQIKAGIYRVVIETFEEDVVPEAKRLSPVTPEGLERNLAKKVGRPGGTGTNRRSIDVEFKQEPGKVVAELFTSSGYGGYLEVGTSRMRPQPYLFPAWVRKGVAGLKPRLASIGVKVLGV